MDPVWLQCKLLQHSLRAFFSAFVILSLLSSLFFTCPPVVVFFQSFCRWELLVRMSPGMERHESSPYPRLHLLGTVALSLGIPALGVYLLHRSARSPSPRHTFIGLDCRQDFGPLSFCAFFPPALSSHSFKSFALNQKRSLRVYRALRCSSLFERHASLS